MLVMLQLLGVVVFAMLLKLLVVVKRSCYKYLPLSVGVVSRCDWEGVGSWCSFLLLLAPLSTWEEASTMTAVIGCPETTAF